MKKFKLTKKKTLAALCVALVLVLTVGTTLAYLSTVTDQKTNVFTFSENVRATLTEPNWDASQGLQLVPGKTVRKDPMITNTGDVDEYVAIRIKFQYGENKCRDSGCKDIDREGKNMSKSDLIRMLNLLEITWNSKWVLCDGTLKINNGIVTDATPEMIFYYNGTLKSGEISEPIFNSIRVKNQSDGIVEADMRWLQSIKVVDGEIVHEPSGIGSYHIKSEGAVIQSTSYSTPEGAKGDLISMFP